MHSTLSTVADGISPAPSYRVSRDVQIAIGPAGVILRGPNGVFDFGANNSDSLRHLLVKSFTEDEFVRGIKRSGSIGVLRELVDLGLVFAVSPPCEDSSPTRQSLEFFQHFSADAETALARIAPIIVGLGGIGCVVAFHLAAAGCRRIGLVDNSYVKTENLNRQFFYCSTEIDHQKVLAARRFLNNRFKALDVEIIHCDATTGEFDDFAREFQPSVIIGAADIPQPILNLKLVSLVNSLSAGFVAGGAGIRSGYHTPVLRGHEQLLRFAKQYVSLFPPKTTTLRELELSEPMSNFTIGTSIGIEIVREALDISGEKASLLIPKCIWS